MMTMAAVWLAPMAGETSEPQRIEALIRHHCTSGDQIEHLRVRAGPDGVIVFGFLMADNSQQARANLRTVILKTLTHEPELRLWRVI